MLQRVRKFGKLSFKEQLLFSEACILQLATGLLLKIIPFRWIPRLYAGKQSIGSSPQSTVFSPQSEVTAMIRNAIGRASRVSPWKNRCLVSSLAGRCMLRRRKIQSRLSLGVIKGGNGMMIAHAWLKAGDFEIVEKNGDYTELFLF